MEMFLYLVLSGYFLLGLAQTHDYPNLLNLQGSPSTQNDITIFGFSDLGAWHLVALPNQLNNSGSFTGPYLENIGWIGTSFIQFQANNDNPINASFTSFPGSLYQNFTLSTGLFVELSLCGASSRSSLIRVKVSNPLTKSLSPQFRWIGTASLIRSTTLSVFNKNGTIGQGIVAQNFSDTKRLEIHIPSGAIANATVNGTSYRLDFPSITLNSGESWTSYLTLSLTFNQTDQQKEQEVIGQMLSSTNASENVFSTSLNRWNTYLNRGLPSQVSPLNARAAVKAIQILMTNWRSPWGPFTIEGLFPSYTQYNGFWAWDSWKHATALASIQPELAQNQVRAMLYLKSPSQPGFEGMIADVLQSDGGINWRNSKPPLAAWAVNRIYQQTTDINFIKEVYPYLVSYHKWWYLYRDVNKNGLCEYGATDGTTTAAKWESGMDNAVRFDQSVMLKTSTNAYSFDQESVDLNSYLYAEKLYLAKFATLLNNTDDATTFTTQAATLKTQIQVTFWNTKTNYFHDRQINGTFINAMGCEGWLPLWAEVATQDQATAVRAALLDSKKFNTFVPFPTVSADDPQFDASGYWRGPMWFDQAYFGIRGLLNTGFQSDGIQLQNKLLTNVQGLQMDSQRSLYEYYNPLNGNAQGSSFFGWSSAHVLMLVNGY